MLQLNCPQCDAPLEIDEGFRGSVCRCFECGALLTVPANPKRERTESLTRPETPGDAETSGGSGSPGAGSEPSEGEGEGESEPRTYQTPSGKRVELSERELEQVPVARRRMGVRIGTVAVVSGIMLALVAGVIFGMAQMMSQGQEQPVDPAAVHSEVFEITENPFLLEEPSFMGLPAPESPLVLMADTSAAMSEHFALISEAILHALGTLEPSQRVQVILWHEQGPIVVPDEPTAAGDVDREEVSRTLEGIYPAGGLAPAAALEEAAKAQPQRIILVLAQPPYPDEMDALAERVEAAGAPLTVVMIDNTSERLTRIAEDSGGALIEISGGRLRRWYDRSLAATSP